MFIRMSRSFIGPNKEQLEEFTLVDCATLQPSSSSDSPNGELSVLFFGTAYVGMVGLDEQGNRVPMPPQAITFPIAAQTREEAFSQFENAATNYLRTLKEESEKAQRKDDLYIPSPAEVGLLSKKLKISE